VLFKGAKYLRVNIGTMNPKQLFMIGCISNIIFLVRCDFSHLDRKKLLKNEEFNSLLPP